MSSLKQTLASDSSLAKFNRTVDNVEHLTSSLAAYLKRNEGKLDQTADNFLSASRKLNRLVSRNADLVDSSVSRVERTSSRLEVFALRLDTLSQTARRFADALENEEGTLQMLMEDRRLYDDLRKTADDLDDLIMDIRNNPGRYINLKVELF